MLIVDFISLHLRYPNKELLSQFAMPLRFLNALFLLALASLVGGAKLMIISQWDTVVDS
jgi:hypothetical protein